MRTTRDDASLYFEKNERRMVGGAPTTEAAPRLPAGEPRPRATRRWRLPTSGRRTLCRCAAGRAAARSAAARTVGTSGGLGGPDARPQVAIAEPQ